MELVPAKGWRIPATPPHVSSYLFLLPVYDAPSSVERRERERESEKIGEEERGGRGGEGDGLSIFIMFAPKKERRGREEGKMEAKRDGGNTRVEKRARRARGTQEFTAAGARV